MLEHHENGRINAIVVLSDGSDADSVNCRLTRCWSRSARRPRRARGQAPVRIFTIAYGEEARQGCAAAHLEGIRWPDVRRLRPDKIDQVFASVINNF